MTTSTAFIPAFTFECGAVFKNVPVAYQTWGSLNADSSNVVVVCHALTGNTQADDWWGELIGPGKTVDTDHYFAVCANVIGSPYGTLSPTTSDPATGRAYGADFPSATVRDTVALHKQLLDSLGVRQVAFAIGGSLGGMQALEWAFFGDYVCGIVPIAVGGRHSAWCIGWSETQRQAIYRDPRWQNGRYDPDSPPHGGLAVARMIAMVSYRSFESFGERFGRRSTSEDMQANFLVETYLHHQGKKFIDRFDPSCYVHLTRTMDTHDVSRNRGDYIDVLRSIEQPALIVGVNTDVLYPLEEQEELHRCLPNSALAVLDAPQGHDAFLIEQQKLEKIVNDWRRATIDPLIGKARAGSA